jgi:hypothetical protein
MNLLVIIVAVTLLTALSWSVLYLLELVKQDGYGLRTGRADPPRSHHRDFFDPSGPRRLA